MVQIEEWESKIVLHVIDVLAERYFYQCFAEHASETKCSNKGKIAKNKFKTMKLNFIFSSWRLSTLLLLS